MMKVKTINIITYGAFLLGAVTMFLAAVLPVFSGYMTILMYSGGAIGIFGLLFCLSFMHSRPCPGCRDFMVLKKSSVVYCPCCKEQIG